MNNEKVAGKLLKMAKGLVGDSSRVAIDAKEWDKILQSTMKRFSDHYKDVTKLIKDFNKELNKKEIDLGKLRRIERDLSSAFESFAYNINVKLSDEFKAAIADLEGY